VCVGVLRLIAGENVLEASNVGCQEDSFFRPNFSPTSDYAPFYVRIPKKFTVPFSMPANTSQGTFPRGSHKCNLSECKLSSDNVDINENKH